MNYGVHPGWIEVISGVMFSGKSEELIRRVRRATIARRKVQDLTVVEQGTMLDGERCDLHFAREKRTVFLVHPAAIDHALGGNQVARQGGEGEAGKFPFQFLRLVEIGHEGDFA